ncbi:hypothetical protein JL722_4481 [Aureococcus anophagefferens]|nr:hypothetical protein JL722_4481 [Aureococcus anophagefferens]
MRPPKLDRSISPGVSGAAAGMATRAPLHWLRRLRRRSSCPGGDAPRRSRVAHHGLGPQELAADAAGAADAAERRGVPAGLWGSNEAEFQARQKARDEARENPEWRRKNEILAQFDGDDSSDDDEAIRRNLRQADAPDRLEQSDGGASPRLAGRDPDPPVAVAEDLCIVDMTETADDLEAALFGSPGPSPRGDGGARKPLPAEPYCEAKEELHDP